VLEQANIPVLLVRLPARAGFSVVLTATDFSDNARRAARCSIALFPDSQHYLLHAYQVAFENRMRMAGASNEDVERYRDNELTSAKAQVAEQAAELNPLHLLRPLLVRSSPTAALLEQSEKVRSDLIVIGKHGGTVLDERLLGSVTQNVLYHANCNVLLVP
jgi:nucleotide-binding universal stress UspA family protein